MITYDRGNKFLGQAFKNDPTEREYGIKAKCETTENPQSNSILERINQFIANLVHTFDLRNNHLDEDDPWSGILAATSFMVQSMYNTTFQATPGQLVFGRGMILNIPFIEYWEAIRLLKQNIIDNNNQLENKNCKLHTVIIQEKLLARNKKANKYEGLYMGPYPITRVWTN